MDIERQTATPENVKFALRKLEDFQSSDAASQSGATALSGAFNELHSVQKKLEEFHHVLMNAEENWEDIQNSDPNIQHSLLELQDVGNSTETALLTYMNQVVANKSITVPEIFKFTNPKPVNFFALHKLMTDIQKIVSRVERITIKHLSAPRERAITQSAQQSLRNVDDICLLGLEIHYKCILQRLVDQSHQTHSVVQVIGTKAFAITVLAEKIYRSTEVKTHFEACFWLFPPTRLVTDDDNIGLTHCNFFKPIDILRKMLLKLGDTNVLDAHDGHYQIMSRLHQSLNGKRCLLVLDNCWMELWTLVNAVFRNGNNGSRVLITSEEQGQSDYKYELPFLDYKDSLELLEELGEKKFSEFEYEGNLLSMADEYHWYSGLPSILKMCIAYTAGVFPCGNIILADSLIRLWIVEGIIPHEEGRTTESIAESYLHQLIQRGSMRIIGACYHNQATNPIRSITLNPIVHRIISSKAQDDTILPVMVIHSVDDLGNQHVPAVASRKFTDLHRLALHLPYEFNHISFFGEEAKPWYLNYPSLHSLFFFGYVPPIQISPFSFLRVLVVFSSHIQFPEEYTPCWLDGLINLRYLGFIVCLVEGRSLGKTLDRLGKLEILDLSASIVLGLSEFINNNKKVNVVGPAKEDFSGSWSPVPDMSQ